MERTSYIGFLALQDTCLNDIELQQGVAVDSGAICAGVLLGLLFLVPVLFQGYVFYLGIRDYLAKEKKKAFLEATQPAEFSKTEQRSTRLFGRLDYHASKLDRRGEFIIPHFEKERLLRYGVVLRESLAFTDVWLMMSDYDYRRVEMKRTTNEWTEMIDNDFDSEMERTRERKLSVISKMEETLCPLLRVRRASMIELGNGQDMSDIRPRRNTISAIVISSYTQQYIQDEEQTCAEEYCSSVSFQELVEDEEASCEVELAGFVEVEAPKQQRKMLFGCLPITFSFKSTKRVKPFYKK